MKKIHIVLAIVFSLPAFDLYCQTDDPNDPRYDISKYFDDGGIATSKAILKLNVVSFAMGDMAVTYERSLTDKFGVEAGLGLLLPYYVPEVPLWSRSKELWDVQDPNLGYSLLVFPKYYMGDSFDYGQFFGIQFRHRNYNLETENIIYNDLTANFGTQIQTKGRFVISFDIGIGYRFSNTPEFDLNGDPKNTFAFPFSIKIGRKL